MSSQSPPAGPPPEQAAPAQNIHMRVDRAGLPPMPVLTGPHFASFWRRFAAVVIDGFITLIAFWLIGILFDVSGFGWANDAIIGVDDFDGGTLLTFSGLPVGQSVLAFIGGWLYHAGLQSSSWQATPGKRAVGIFVTDLAGDRISFPRATGRHFATFLSEILLAGYLIQPFTAKRQALHDLIAGTLVVKR